ncbi:hypothetical protein [Paenibacillus aestuarii]|uniref:Uncharacterized protein n=1 Tax=Paenibacillus aestuarii TaxID=516965 RepID=A0ABW0KA13_9BACL|nr:hypothetical protein [Paenibacillus aestuarii]
MSNSKAFDAFITLNRYFALIQTSKPTRQQADEAVRSLCQLYGVSNEQELLMQNDSTIIQAYTELKAKIMKDAI